MRVERNRLFAAVLPLVMITVMSVGCGGGAEEEPAAEVEQPATQPAVQPVEQPAAREAVAEEPAVVREAAESPFGFYTIQISSWKTATKADSEARRYQGLGLEAYVQKADIPGMGIRYRVRVGRYPALTDAREAARSLVGMEANWIDNFSRGEVPPNN